MTAKAPAKGHPAKHSATKKHVAGKASKKHAEHLAHLKHLHHLHEEHLAHLKAVGKPAPPVKPAKPAAFAIGDWLPVCAAEAVAMSLRLAGGAVSDEDVLRLHVLAAGPETAPASILEVLEAAFRFGLAGVRPLKADALLEEARVDLREGSVGVFDRDLQPVLNADLHAASAEARHGVLADGFDEVLLADLGVARRNRGHALILGVTRPGYHAVLATPDGWWSWGKLYSPWNARVEEAWGVSWG